MSEILYKFNLLLLNFRILPLLISKNSEMNIFSSTASELSHTNNNKTTLTFYPKKMLMENFKALYTIDLKI